MKGGMEGGGGGGAVPSSGARGKLQRRGFPSLFHWQRQNVDLLAFDANFQSKNIWNETQDSAERRDTPLTCVRSDIRLRQFQKRLLSLRNWSPGLHPCQGGSCTAAKRLLDSIDTCEDKHNISYMKWCIKSKSCGRIRFFATLALHTLIINSATVQICSRT